MPRHEFGNEFDIRYFSLELDDVSNPDTDLEYDGFYLKDYINF